MYSFFTEGNDVVEEFRAKYAHLQETINLSEKEQCNLNNCGGVGAVRLCGIFLKPGFESDTECAIWSASG